VARRALSLTALFMLVVLGLLAAPLLMVGALVVDLGARRRLAGLRFVLCLEANLLLHAVGVLALLGGWLVAGPWTGASFERRARFTLAVEHGFAQAAFAVAARLFRLRLEVENLEQVTDGPFLLMPRHVSILDVLLPLLVAGAPQRRHLRFAVKRALLWDPFLDLCGHTEVSAFLRRDRGDPAPEIQAVARLGEGLGPADAVVLFPEGTRFTAEKRARRLAELARQDPTRATRAQGLSHLLPPHLGGALALLERCPGVDVVFMGHTGLEGIGHFRDLLSGALLDRTIVVRLWRCPASAVPASREDRADWLYDWWQQVDDWVGRAAQQAALVEAK